MGTSVDTFGGRLRDELTARNMGIRTLAKRITADDPGRMEGVRRRLNKYVNEGVTPTDGARHEIEDALGVKRDSLLIADEDDEEAAAMREAFDLFRALMQRVNSRKAVAA